MVSTLAWLLLFMSVLGIVLLMLQTGLALAHLRRSPRLPVAYPGISILKPLCGVDDALASNLRSFSELAYPNYEVLLGVEHERDPAYALACRTAACFPGRMRVVVQRGAPGLNPKVNQLITLAQRAHHDLLVVSDSNTAVEADYLSEIAALFEDDRVGIVTHPIAGVGEESLGALLDNLHLSASIGPAMIGANRFGAALVVGKSMAFRRRELVAIGGFEALKDVLAEDFVMGRMIVQGCAKRVAVARRAIMNVSCRRSLGSFVERYTRWCVLQRTMVGRPLYTAQLVLNPVPLALTALLLEPTRHSFSVLVLCGATKTALDCLATRAVQPGEPLRLRLLAVPVKDLLLFCAWISGMFKTQVQWRGHRLVVLAGTRLAAPSPQRSHAYATAALRRALRLRSWIASTARRFAWP